MDKKQLIEVIEEFFAENLVRKLPKKLAKEKEDTINDIAKSWAISLVKDLLSDAEFEAYLIKEQFRKDEVDRKLGLKKNVN